MAWWDRWTRGARRLASTRLVVSVCRPLTWVSPLGWGVLAAGLGAWAVGARWGWTELLMIGAAALVLVVACAALAIGKARVVVAADVHPTRVTVGDPATGRIAVTNTGTTPLLPLLVELPVGVNTAGFVLPPLVTGRTHEDVFIVPTHRRGVIPIGPARTVQGDPLGLVRRTVEWTEVTELYVHPRTVALESLGAGLLRDLEGSVTEDQSMSDLAFHALRDYQPGDDRRFIHWRSSAKAGRLLVRQFLDTRRSHVTILLDPDEAAYRGAHRDIASGLAGDLDERGSNRPGASGPAAAGSDTDTGGFGRTGGRGRSGRTLPVPAQLDPAIPDLETAVSVAGSIALRCHRDETAATLVAGRHTAAKAGPQRTLDTLARLEPVVTAPTSGSAGPSTPDPQGLHAAAATAAALAPDTSELFVITGPRRPFVELQRAASQFGPEVRTVVIVVDGAAERGIRPAGGLTVLTVDTLDRLRQVLAAGVRA